MTRCLFSVASFAACSHRAWRASCSTSFLSSRRIISNLPCSAAELRGSCLLPLPLRHWCLLQPQEALEWPEGNRLLRLFGGPLLLLSLLLIDVCAVSYEEADDFEVISRYCMLKCCASLFCGCWPVYICSSVIFMKSIIVSFTCFLQWWCLVHTCAFHVGTCIEQNFNCLHFPFGNGDLKRKTFIKCRWSIGMSTGFDQRPDNLCAGCPFRENRF